MNPLEKLRTAGQSPWYDYIQRGLITSGELQEMIDNDFKAGASHVILADKEGETVSFEGVNDALADQDIDLRIFGKQTTRRHRRMAVVLAPTLEQAKIAAKKIKVIIK